MSTYYTPSIEEFHVGFEYEIFEDWDYYEKKSWHPQVYGKDGRNHELLGHVSSPIESKSIRVKHLDREDIEAEGWEEYAPYIHVMQQNEATYYLAWGMVGHITISTQRPLEQYCIYRGKCLNKSKLRTTMKDVGIL